MENEAFASHEQAMRRIVATQHPVTYTQPVTDCGEVTILATAHHIQSSAIIVQCVRDATPAVVVPLVERSWSEYRAGESGFYIATNYDISLRFPRRLSGHIILRGVQAGACY
jgi:hypothetical protein